MWLEAGQAYGFRKPAEPVPTRPHRLRPRVPTPVTHRNIQPSTTGTGRKPDPSYSNFEGPDKYFRIDTHVANMAGVYTDLFFS
jgi:hypothetical protein